MDPQQRLLLEYSFLAFRDAGYDREELQGRNVGVFVGISSPDAKEVSLLSGERSVFSANSSSNATAAGRISYTFVDMGQLDDYGDRQLEIVPNPRHALIAWIEAVHQRTIRHAHG